MGLQRIINPEYVATYISSGQAISSKMTLTKNIKNVKNKVSFSIYKGFSDFPPTDFLSNQHRAFIFHSTHI